jgi:murein DD-endopeptidase MepM/ murein hydrolase activator NlpD
MITIQTDSGWQITFMHMDSRAVSVGDQVEQGQYVGASGNTGNSTGPHLHLQVHDSSGKEINPVFIIPFSTIEASETF